MEDDDLDLLEQEFDSVDIRFLRRHVAHLGLPAENGKGDGFSAEFNTLERTSDALRVEYSAKAAELEVNKRKNRYGNVMPWDHTRVVLPGTQESGEDYINANYIRHVLGGRCYIASQGPLSSTINDFWRMVWSERTQIIVMLTRIKENDRMKCSRYWPLRSRESYGSIVVEPKETQLIINDFVELRRFHVSNSDEPDAGTREIFQFQYEEWPDHGTPECTDTFRTLMSTVDEYQKDESIPLVIHCSAGIGRTGTFCTVHSVMHSIRQSSPGEPYELNLPKIVMMMRRDRSGMVQTKEQYEFCYAAILEALENECADRLTDESPESATSRTSSKSKPAAFSLSSDEESDGEDDKMNIRDRYRPKRM
eukprot:TRINITY_DN1116_c0_g1_i1.p1 TRINITY_DN1116_c0_g1~~TRINITY_DN1116_c0_g1_i1.p1  ORF type:complete len:365 (-),score=97.04 TRINITY_DN1116_c0_g1_i1:179-1273(-)